MINLLKRLIKNIFMPQMQVLIQNILIMMR